MIKTISLLLILVSFTSFAADANKIAEALEDHLSDSLAFDSASTTGEHHDTIKRKYEDELPMWLTLYVRPNLNWGYPGYYGKGFAIGRDSIFYTNIPDISNSKAFQMRHESPWSFRFSGIGKVIFYRQAHYRDQVAFEGFSSSKKHLYSFYSSNDRPKVMSFTHRERIGSIKFCPGVSFYQNRDYIGDVYTRTFCNPKPRQWSGCVKTATTAKIKNARSFHFDAIIDKVYLYRGNNCDGAYSWYSWNKQRGTVRSVSSNVQNQIRSMRVLFKSVRDYGLDD